MVLTMANRGVYFFQAGTEELVNEWVSTCNYWAARTSKEPLAGGVSNMEYGWNKVMADSYGRDDPSQSQSEFHRDDIPDTVSVRSGKSSRSKYGWRDVNTIRGPYSPRTTDKIFVNDWKPPLPPTVASTHDEEGQLEALRKHVVSLKKDLETHNELRGPMAALVRLSIPNIHRSSQCSSSLVSILHDQRMLLNRWPIGKKSLSIFSERL
jgi:PH/SEC7 domain-containing protein